MTENACQWTQEQATAHEAALDAINDLIAGYSEDLDVARNANPPIQRRIFWLELRISQARKFGAALDPADDASAAQTLREFSAMFRARKAST